MMFDVKNGRGFSGTIDYDRDLDGRHDKDARILFARGVDVFYNQAGKLDADSRQLARSFRAQAMMNPDVKKCVKHLWVSYLPEDQLAMVNNKFKTKHHFNNLEDAVDTLGQQRVNAITDMAMEEDTKRLLHEMKYDKTQFLIVRHSEKDNPHVHVIVNVVDNDGKRLKDFQEKKRGIKICKQITEDRNYKWGQHKSVSKTVSNNPKDNARADICKKVFEITQTYHTAAELKKQAALAEIEVRYSTNYITGEITGISFAKDGFLFPATRVDSSLSAKKLFPSQVSSKNSLSNLPEQAQNIVKSGGVIAGFNDQKLAEAMAPALPQFVIKSKTRDEYHMAIEQATNEGSRTAYIQNIAGLALDQNCGPSEERAEAVTPYIIAETTDQIVNMNRLHEIVRVADEQAMERKPLFRRFLEFLKNLLRESYNMRRFPITSDTQHKIRWSDLIDENPGKTVGLATSIQASVKETYEYQQRNNREIKAAEEAAKKQTPTQSQNPVQSNKQKPGLSESNKDNKGVSKGMKFHI